MAPGLIDTTTDNGTSLAEREHKKEIINGAGSGRKEAFAQSAASTNYEGELKGIGKFAPARYPNYLPVWEDTTYPPLEVFDHHEHGKDADPSFPNLLKGADVADLCANIGAEVNGVQLSKLDKAGKDELALFVAQKKVVAFRDQDFADLPIQDALDYAEYYGPSHIHQASGAPKGFPRVHLVHRSADDKTVQSYFQTRTNSTTWHSDVSFEKQPPGTTFLYILDGPTAGGDTSFVNTAEAYKRLSPAFRERLHGLKAIHSGHEQAAAARARNSVVRREPIATAHPIVRTHPATGEKALYVNQQFTRNIEGYKVEESEALLKFLYDHLAYSQDLQARVKWAPGTVVVWDNRVTAHTAILDWQDGQRRHLARLTPQAEQPYETPYEGGN